MKTVRRWSKIFFFERMIFLSNLCLPTIHFATKKAVYTKLLFIHLKNIKQNSVQRFAVCQLIILPQYTRYTDVFNLIGLIRVFEWRMKKWLFMSMWHVLSDKGFICEYTHRKNRNSMKNKYSWMCVELKPLTQS